jgi:hypothetical protein
VAAAKKEAEVETSRLISELGRCQSDLAQAQVQLRQVEEEGEARVRARLNALEQEATQMRSDQ